jgi:hypothetical protein
MIITCCNHADVTGKLLKHKANNYTSVKITHLLRISRSGMCIAHTAAHNKPAKAIYALRS